MPRLLRLIGGEPGAHAAAVPRIAQVVAAPGPLDLDDVGAEVGEQHGAVGAGDDPREVEDPDAVEHQERSRKPSVIALTSGMPARAMALMRALHLGQGLERLGGQSSAYSRAALMPVGRPARPGGPGPSCRASSAAVAPAVQMISFVRAPARPGGRSGWSRPPPAATPRSTSGSHNWADGGGDAEVAGQRQAPAAADGVAVDGAMVDLLEVLEQPCWLARRAGGTGSCGAKAARRSSADMLLLRPASAPAEKTGGAPVTMTTRVVGSSRSSAKAAPSSVSMGSLSELRRSGRLSVTVAMGRRA